MWRELEVVEAESGSGVFFFFSFFFHKNENVSAREGKELPVCTLMGLFRQVGWMIQSSPSVPYSLNGF